MTYFGAIAALALDINDSSSISPGLLPDFFRDLQIMSRYCYGGYGELLANAHSTTSTYRSLS